MYKYMGTVCVLGRIKRNESVVGNGSRFLQLLFAFFVISNGRFEGFLFRFLF